MLIVSDRQLTLHGIGREAGIPFEEPDEQVAADLIRRGVARRSEPPRIIYEIRNQDHRSEKETNYSEAREVRPEVAAPFRNVPVPDQEPQEVAPAGDTVLPSPDLPEQRASDNRGWRRRKGHRSR
jgi:hypothetical protein